jgi:putative transposase
VDLGLSAFATVLTEHRDGTEEIGTFPSPRYLRRKERALARSQRNMSRKKKGSANRAKARIKVAGLHRRVANARLDHAHKVAHDLVALHSTIVIEDLNVTGIAKGRLAKSTHDAGLGQFRRVLAEKCERNGRALIAVDRFFPSTRMCSSCQQLTGPTGLAELKVRVWDCSVCGASHDRDVNAARNLLAEGVRLLSQ